jgi:hypothetical protein
LAKAAQALPRPIVAYVSRFALEEGQDGTTAFGYATVNLDPREARPPELLGVAWINMEPWSPQAIQAGARGLALPSRQQTESHELAHLLAGEGHNSVPGNLLSVHWRGLRLPGDPPPRPAMDLSAAQCASILASPWVRPIGSSIP